MRTRRFDYPKLDCCLFRNELYWVFFPGCFDLATGLGIVSLSERSEDMPEDRVSED